MAVAQARACAAAVVERGDLRDSLDTAEAEFQKHQLAPLTLTEVEFWLEHVKLKQKELEEITKRITASSLPEDLDDHRNQHKGLFLQALKLLSNFTAIKMTIPQAAAAAAGPVNPATTSCDIRLPRIELPAFSGNLMEWVSFRDIFCNAIHDNKNISKTQKMTYLKSALQGEAARLIQSMLITDANYDIAWSQLSNRYQNDREILFATLRKFVNQSNVQPGSSSSTRQLVDTSRECLRALYALNVPDKFDALMMYHVFTKIDSSSKELWEQGLKDSSIPTFKNLCDFLENRARALGSSAPKVKPMIQGHGKVEEPKFQRNQTRNVHHIQVSKCKCCSDTHFIYKCPKFNSMSQSERFEFVKKGQLCCNCLRDGHLAFNCQSSSVCRYCGGKHHSLLHRQKAVTNAVTTPNPVTKKEDGEENKISAHTLQQNSGSFNSTPTHSQTILATAVVGIPDVHGVTQYCRAFLDNGSDDQYITESLITRLGLPRSHHKVSITGLGESSVGFTRGISQLTISLIVPKITGKLPHSRLDHNKWDHLQGLQLADPQYHVPGEIEVLLGSEVFYHILQNGRKCGPAHSPVAVKSSLGWLIGGGSKHEASVKSLILNHTVTIPTQQQSHNNDESLDGLLRLFWELETLPPQPKPLTKEEEACEAHYLSTYRRDDQGCFTVQIPFKTPHPVIGSSLDIAVRRLKSLERRLSSQPHYKEEYLKFMREYESLGHMIEVSALPNESNSCYIPHHFVLKESSTTTKFRVVFDASARTSSGVSLNETMMVGASLQDNLADIIMRFRLHKIAFTADIAKMYRQIRVDPTQQDFQRIVWREDPSLPVKHFKLKTVTYGTASAPYLATRTIKELAKLEEHELPLASEVALRDLFVDDLMSGAPTNKEAIAIQSQIIELSRRGGFQLRKWISNSPEVLQSLPSELLESVSLSFDSDNTVKTLGISWSPLPDHFLFKITNPDDNGKSLTKRIILSEVAKIFDPIGWLAPVIIRAKLLMQEVWKLDKVGWDDRLPSQITDEWTSIKEDLPLLEELKIDRHQGYQSSINKFENIPPHIKSRQTVCLAGFCDASERAYAAATYLCVYNYDEPPVITLINSKSRVAPIKQVSLPRLELCGAVLLAELLESVQRALRIQFHSVSAWTDSTVVLGWIQGHPSKWKNFVANRVTKIQNRIPSNLWGHVRGIENPADCASRGISSIDLINHQLWWHGPSWFKNGVPVPNSSQTNFDIHDEERQVTCVATTANEPILTNETLLFKFSSLMKLQRVTAYVFRFLRSKFSKSCRIQDIIQMSSSEATTGSLTTKELDIALMFWIRKVQDCEFSLKLSAFLLSQTHYQYQNQVNFCTLTRTWIQLASSEWADDFDMQRFPWTRNIPWCYHAQAS